MDIENTDTTTARVLESTATFDKASLLLGQKNNTVHFSLPQTTWFDSPPSTVAHRHRAEVGACLCDSFGVGATRPLTS